MVSVVTGNFVDVFIIRVKLRVSNHIAVVVQILSRLQSEYGIHLQYPVCSRQYQVVRLLSLPLIEDDLALS